MDFLTDFENSQKVGQNSMSHSALPLQVDHIPLAHPRVDHHHHFPAPLPLHPVQETRTTIIRIIDLIKALRLEVNQVDLILESEDSLSKDLCWVFAKDFHPDLTEEAIEESLPIHFNHQPQA